MRIILALAVLAAGLAAPGIVHAADIDKVEIGPAGPKAPLPVRKSFYMEGDVPPSVMEVWPVFVRYQRSPFGARVFEFNEADDCQQVRNALVLDTNPKSTPLGKKTGRIEVDELWQSNPRDPIFSDLRWDHDAYVPSGWKRPPEEEGKSARFSVLISAPDFFTEGSHYCLFLYRKVTETREDFETVRTLALRYAARRRDQNAGRPDTTCQSDPATCLDEELTKELGRELSQKLNLDEQDSTAERMQSINELKHYVRTKLVTAVEALTRAPNVVNTALTNWSQLLTLHENVRGWRPSGDFLSIQDDALARAIAKLLVENGKELRWNGTAFIYNTLTVTHLRIRADLEGIVFASSASPAKPSDFDDVDIDLTGVPVLGTELSLRDVLEYGAARIRTENSYEDAVVVAARAKTSMGLETDHNEMFLLELKSDDETFIQDLQARINALTQFEQRAREACQRAGKTPRAASLRSTEQEILALLGEWISRQVLTQPTPTPDSGTKRPEMACPSVKDESRLWPSAIVANVDEQSTERSGALKLLGDSLQSYVAAVKNWRESERESVLRIANTRIETPVVTEAGDVPLTQTSYVEQYITPFLGYGYLPAENIKSAARISFGIELTAYPNPVNDPMWSNGKRDWSRAFALQLGVLTAPFGPQERLGAPPDLPAPFFAALAFHLAPWTSISYGAAFVGERRSTLSQEQPRWLVTHFVSIGVQLNIPGLITSRTAPASPNQ
ncbi:hypothetical protein LY474_00810 [Myxococcus stipitatus]|uniref:hypothetical protein n=1 Tax=Myxococcus stipitatus TaxID=83455 RepID=UPI001F438898|nr:hypothetical protein [Myxococcus stipitatus]MCE9666337.1 hypothetical protein [Myxococcus stipitatus]